MQLTSKSVTFPPANKCLPLQKFSVLLQELSRALFRAFTHLHQLQITQKRSKMSSVAVMRRGNLNTLLTELHKEGVG